MGIERFIKPNLFALGGYAARTSPDTLDGKVEVAAKDIIKLDANENPYGCSPRVNRALAAYPDFSVYPDTMQEELRKELAGYTGIGAEYIVAGSGSNQLIDLIFRLFVGQGDEVMNCAPTFDLYRFDTEMCGGKLVEVVRDSDFAVNVDKVKAAVTDRTRLIVLANPNNPTGTLTSRKDILEMLETGVPVLLDEAYYEFCGETVVPLVERYQNLMVLRTFSKWAGLAGLRIGYGVFHPQIADVLLKLKIPYNVNVAALVAVRESLKDMDYLMARVKAIIDERARLFEELGKLGFLKPFPSSANFIYCAVLKGKASDIWQKLEKKGILVRYFDRPLLRNSIRVSVGKPENTDALIKALKALEKEL
ncbi:MAG: histidinol-phosphate transaminase [Chloroflexi bacterium]|nr:histidinol-phosphate transaminase [Chloroflexota bacterium]